MFCVKPKPMSQCSYILEMSSSKCPWCHVKLTFTQPLFKTSTVCQLIEFFDWVHQRISYSDKSWQVNTTWLRNAAGTSPTTHSKSLNLFGTVYQRHDFIRVIFKSDVCISTEQYLFKWMRIYTKYLSLYNNEIPTATSTFSGSSNTVGLLWILSDVGVTGKSKMAAINRIYTCNNEYLSLHTW